MFKRLSNQKMTTADSPKIRLNHPCEYCKKTIYIGDGSIIEEMPLHFKCYKKKALSMQEKRISAEIENKIKNMDFYFDTQLNREIAIGMLRELKSAVEGKK